MMQQPHVEDFTGLHSYLASDHQQNGTGANAGIYGYNYHQLFPASFINNSYEVGGGSYSSTPSTTPLYGGRYQQQQQHGMMSMEIGGDIGGSNYNNSNNSSSNNYKAMMALRNHKEAEKRRRERINSHLDRLRALLPCNSKTDKATLLAKVVQRVGELNQQTSHLINLDDTMPTSTDSYSVYTLNDQHKDYDDFHGGDAMKKGRNKKFILKASLCCEDRADLFADLIETLDSLNLKTLRAEISTLGGRVRNVLIVSRASAGGDHEEEEEEEEEEEDGCGSEEDEEECIGFLHEALKGIVERSSSSNANERVKRRRRLIVDPMTTSC